MSDAQSNGSRWLAFGLPFVVLLTVTPNLVRFWPTIVEMLPIWARIALGTAVLLAAAIGLAGIAALITCRGSLRSGNA